MTESIIVDKDHPDATLIEVDCEDCRGTGLAHNERDCGSCHGKGYEIFYVDKTKMKGDTNES